MAQQRTSGRAAHSSRKKHVAGEASGRRWTAEMRPTWLRGRPAEDGRDKSSTGQGRDSGVSEGIGGSSGGECSQRECDAWPGVMATVGTTDAVWHMHGHGEPKREWPRGRGRRAEGSGMGAHRIGHVPRGQSEELSGYPCNGHGGRRFSATAKYPTRANKRGNWGNARENHDGLNGTLGKDRGARGGADRMAMSRWPKVEEDGNDVDLGVLDLISLAHTK
uniref:Uncharacterized protein n=1 Tax=Triticum turgidum subsp. durum TaxID=4567 RepID=S4SR66_TRITD|nr:hypothetical protein [Triticum turgidum subsp. durum]